MTPAPLTMSSARLRYQPLCAAHADEVFDFLSDERLYAFIPAEPPASLTALRERYEKLSVGRSPDGTARWLNWLMRAIPTDTPIGLLQATVTPDRNAYIAYFVFSAQQRQGFACEGVSWMLANLTMQHGVVSATADVDTRNDASNRLLARLGFECIGMTTDADTFKGAGSDEFHYRKQ